MSNNPLDLMHVFRPSKSTLTNLLNKKFPDIRYVCNPYVPEGLTILAGRPKIGKTTLARGLMAAASSSDEFLGKKCEVTNSLFLSLEESERLVRRKFSTISNANTDRIDLQFSWPRGEEGVNALRDYLFMNPEIKLVVIDSLSKFRSLEGKASQQFLQDYEAVSALQNLAKEFEGLAIVLLHHTTKAFHEDPIDCISGTYGISAAMDSFSVLRMNAGKYQFSCGGRDWDEEISDFELERKDKGWVLLGSWDSEIASQPPARGQVLEILKREGVVTGDGIAKRLSITKQTASQHLNILMHEGLVRKTSDGWSAL